MSARDIDHLGRRILSAGILGVSQGATESILWILDLEKGGRLFRLELGDGEETLGSAERRIERLLAAGATTDFEDNRQPRGLGDAFAATPLIVLAPAAQAEDALGCAVRQRLGFSEERPLVFLRADREASLELDVILPPSGEEAAVGETLKRRLSLILDQLDCGERLLRQVSVLSEEEYQAMVVEPNLTVRPYPGGDSLGSLFRRCADRFPETEALWFGDSSLTYSELKARAERLAGTLRAEGLAPGETVGILAERSLAAVISILGVVLAGGVYVPLSLQWPRARLEQIERQAGLALIVDCTGSGPGPGSCCPSLPVDTAVAEGRPFDGADGRRGSDRIYILFTSGSTGEPKGVEVLHRGVTRLVFDRDLHPIAPGMSMMHAAPLTFDASTAEIWLPLLNGGILWGFDKEEVLNAETFMKARRGRRLDMAFLTTALFETLLDQDSAALSGIDRLYVGGESFRPGSAAAALKTAGLGTLIHCYGPTETTVYAIATALRPEDAAGGAVPLGKPIANTTAYVLDRHLRPTPPEAEGEIFIGGDGVARGYLGDPERTAAAFVPDIVSGGDGRLYRTGDRARIRPDGMTVFAGRTDNQVKIRGHRIELGEIEAALNALPDVERAVVRVHSPVERDRRLLAWVKPSPPQPEEPKAFAREVERRVRTLLPDYMVPSWILPVDRFPLTAHGKLDVSALPRPEAEARAPSEIDRSDPLPGVLEVFRSRLVNPALTPEQSFLESGGDSLLAIRVAQDIDRLCGLSPPIALFFEPATPRLVSDFLRVAFWNRDAKGHAQAAPSSSSVTRF